MVSSVPKKKHFPPESARDDWIRMTLRLPPDLHRDIAASAGALSMNAAIVQRLAQSFASEHIGKLMEDTLREKREAIDEVNLASGVLKRAIDQRDKFWNEGFEEGRKQGLEDIKSLIEDTVRDAVQKVLNNKRP